MNTAVPAELTYVNLLPGDRCASLRGRTVNHESFWFDCLAGRYSVFCFFLSAADPLGRSAVEAIARHDTRLDDAFASVAAVSISPTDEPELRDRERIPGVRFVWDFDLAFSRACGAVGTGGPPGAAQAARRFWLILDPSLHVLARFPFDPADPDHERVFRFIERLPPPAAFGGVEAPAPILMLPNVFERDFCRTLIAQYETHGGLESGVVRDNKGVLDAGFKRRKDHIIQDQALIEAACARIKRRVAPEIERLFFMTASRIERHIVACYAAEDGGHFRPHRDNDYGLTAHRRYAVSINLNDDFEGGGVYFPEYSRRAHKAPAGWALIFPCAALHAVQPVGAGRRYAYLPFLYDEAGRTIRDEMRSRIAGANAAADRAESA